MKKRLKFKNILALLLAAAFLGAMTPSLAPAALADGESETISIYTAEDFVVLAERCTLDTWSQGKKVVLQADLSLSAVESPTIPIFGGEFDGNGHTISGLSITQAATPNGLFGILQESGVVKNLKVNGSVEPSGDGSSVGGIVGENYGKVTGCTFTGNVSGERNVGGVAGINAATGQIKECRASGSVLGEKMTGGITGCNLGVIETCQNNAYVNTVSVDPTVSPEDIKFDFSLDLSTLSSMDTSTSASDTGGIAGYSSGIVSGCINNAPVGYPHIGYNVGGIIGRSCGYIHDCENNADIFGRKDVGGIAGQMEPYIARNITESTLAKLQRQLDELDSLLDTALNDTNTGVNSVTSRLNRIADYLDSAAGAASNIRTYGSVGSTVTGSGAAGSNGSVTVTPPQVEAGGSIETAGGAGAIVIPGGGAAGGGISSEGELQGGLTEGGAGGEHQASASGNASASTQITVTTNLSGLSSAISGMSGQMRLLNGEISGTSGTLTGDMKAIQAQISAISDTAMELFQGDGDGDVLVDSSDLDIDLVTLGKASSCKNYSGVQGDINVGGITGAMAMEYELDPEDDITSNLSGTQRRKLEVKVIIQKCVNSGKIEAKRSYAGGICGRMDLGLIAHSEDYGNVTSENGDYVGGIAGLASSTVRQCFAKCTLSGEQNIGGIVGSGIAEDFSGESSTVAGCYSMVSIEAGQEFVGAISGANAGNFEENYFVSDTLTGINGRSYTGKAEPISYETLLNAAGKPASEEETANDADKMETGTIPENFLQLALTFVAEDEVIKTVPFQYGASFDETVYPEVPEKEGYYTCWDKTELQNLHFDTVVTASYTPYVSALSNTETRADGRPIFFLEGQFDDGAEATATVLPSTPDEFDGLAAGWTGFVTRLFSGKEGNDNIVEQWSISLPDDGQRTHTVRYLAPDGDPEHLAIYVKGENGWRQAETEIIGSYLTFPMEGLETEVAVLSTASVWWVWLLKGILVLLLLLLIVFLTRKIVRAVRLRPANAVAEDAESGSPKEQPDPDGAAPREKKRWTLPLLISLAALVVLAAVAAILVLPGLLDDVKAYDLLKEYAEKQELSMELTVNAALDDQDLAFTALVNRTEVEGRRVTVISQDDRTLYYCDGTVFLENGNAYRISSSFPDYSELLDQTMELYQYVEIEGKDGACTITARDEDAKEILELLIPSAAGLLSETNELQVTLLEDGGEVSELQFSGSGALEGDTKPPFQVSATMKLDSEAETLISIPEAVRTAMTSGDYEAAEALSDDLLRMVNAWQTLNHRDSIGAKLLLKADCGPVSLDDHLEYYRWNCDGVQINSVQKNGYALYFTDTTICNQTGDTILAADAATVEAAQLLEIAYQLCLNAVMDCSEADGNYTYTLSLDEEGMKAVAYAIASAAEGMDILFDSGSIQVVICEEQIQSIGVSCGGSVQIVLSKADVAFEAHLEFAEGTDAATIPQAVRETLESQRGE